MTTDLTYCSMYILSTYLYFQAKIIWTELQWSEVRQLYALLLKYVSPNCPTYRIIPGGPRGPTGPT
jgi:hypothetical protein